jgi:hypothetical protein
LKHEKRAKKKDKSSNSDESNCSIFPPKVSKNDIDCLNQLGFLILPLESLSMSKKLFRYTSFSGDGTYSLVFGLLFLVTYWIVGYDGITFSDEVTYLQLGHQLWHNEPVVSEYHFTSRWGAFLFSGYFTYLLGFHDRYASLATLLFYMVSLSILWKVTPQQFRKWTVVFFISHVYLLHFLPKVYPDGFLILWIILIPASSIFRERQPVWAAFIMATAFFVGFCTKETIVLLFPFPLLLLWLDYKSFKPLSFYGYFLLFSLLLCVLYLGYYQWLFGDWLYRFTSVNEGHYISEYTYHDKGWPAVVKRISYLPLITFIERTYWLWIVMALPGIYYGIKKRVQVSLEFGLAVICLIVGFWFMTSTLEFYNPIYLNPRHLIIWIGPLAVSIAMGAKYWLHDQGCKIILSSLLAVGGIFAIIYSDEKIGLFYFILAGILFIRREHIKFALITVLLLLSAAFAAYYQHQLKNYPHFLRTFQSSIFQAAEDSPVLTNEFVVYSKDILLNQPHVQVPLHSLYHLDSIKTSPPPTLTLLVYKYYQHAYPDEQLYIDQAEKWIEENYQLVDSVEDPWLSIRSYRLER